MRPCYIKKTSTNTSDHSPDKSSKETQIQQVLITVQSKEFSIQAATQYYEVARSTFSDCVYKADLLAVQYAFMQ